MKYGWIAVLLTVALFVILVVRMPCGCEGFATSTDADDRNLRYIQSVIGKIKRVGGFLINKQTWIDGFKLRGKSAVELARMQILSEKSRG